MHIDSRVLDDNSIIEGDICIIGAGAAGISIALEWMNTPYKVILLESGGFEYDVKIQELNAGETSGQKYFPLQSSRLRFFGGTTGHWQGMCSPFDPIDFKKRSYVPHSGWPISREDLDPYYARANKTIQLGPYNYDLEYWKNEIPNLIPFPLDSRVIWNKMWQKNPTRFGETYKDTIVNSKNIFLYTYATVVNIQTNKDITSTDVVHVRNHSGKKFKVKAKYYIMACGAIQNARLLLASNTQAVKGLGNVNDNVGRYFMEHFEMICSELWLFNKFPTDLYFADKIKAELAITEAAQIQYGILNGTSKLRPLDVYKNVKPAIETWQDTDPRKALQTLQKSSWLTKLLRLKSKMVEPTAFLLDTRMEQCPNPNSRVTLGSDKDELGIPKAHLHWELTALDKYSLRKIHEIIGKEMAISGLGRVKLKEFLQDENNSNFHENADAGWHHMGTTRMSEDPKNGVVNPNCKVHGINNLFVAGSGCFVTAGAPNPTLTLIALSIRLSDHVMKLMKTVSANV
jgi:choline dehydrogenase-like flavoprotein